MTLVRTVLLAGLTLALSGSFALAAEPEKPKNGETISYYKEVRPIFQQHCQGCHQPAKPQGGYVMTEYATLFKAGDHSEPGIVPGKPDKSLIVEQIDAAGRQSGRNAQGPGPLPKDDVEKIVKWIAQGAKDDTPVAPAYVVDDDHPPVYTLPPVITSLDYSPDGTLLAVSGYHEILLHKADGSGSRGPAHRSIGAHPIAGIFAGRQVPGSRPAVRPAASAKCKSGTWQEEAPAVRLVTFDTLYGVSWSHDSSKVAFGCCRQHLRAIDAATGKQMLFQGAHNDWVLGTTFRRTAAYLVRSAATAR